MNHRFRQALGAAVLLLAPALAAAEDVTLTPDTTLVELGPAKVTLRDFEARLAEVPEKHRRGMADDPQRLGQLLEQIVRQRLLADRARQAGLAERPDVKARLELARDQALAKAMLDHVRDSAEPADYEQLAREHYLTNPDEFMAPERITVSHVLVSTEERPEDEARALAGQVMAAARGGEKPFEELVREYSDDPGADRNAGRLTDVERGQMVAPFEEAAFALEEAGDLAGPVKTRFGFHVIRLEGRKPAEKRPFDAVKANLVERMKERHQDRAVKQYLGKLMNEHDVNADPEIIQALRERYRKPQGEDGADGSGDSR